MPTMTGSDKGVGVSRRTMLKIAGGGLAGMAGCTGGGSNSGGGGTTEDTGGDSTPTAGGDNTTTSGGTDFPTKTINWWIPFSKGGGQDIGQRTLAPYLEEELGVSMALSNKTGGGSGVAMQQLASTEPTGYTISGSYLEYQYLMQKVFGFDYDPMGLQPIYQWAKYPFVITVDADSSYQSVQDLIEASKDRELKYSTVSMGGADHLAGLLLEEQTAFKGRPVPFSGGGETSAALLGGRVDFQLPSLAAAKPRVEAGEMRPLVMFSPPRDEFPAVKDIFPDIPTIYELDMIDDPWEVWAQRGAVAPPGIPEERRKVLTEAFAAATAKDEWQQKARGQNEIVHRRGPEGYMENLNAIAEDYEPYLPLLKESVERLQS